MTVETFHLAPPPQFRGLDPYKPINVYVRHLPHWRQADATYFVTFRLADALPQSKLQYLKRWRAEWERTHPEPRSKDDWDAHAREIFSQEEAWLDEGFGACHFRESRHATRLAEALLHFQEARYFLSSWVIMPNHCHLVVQPKDDWQLEDILKGVKGVVARQINKAVGSGGAFWQQESYDRIIRDEEHLWRVVQYIGRNPARADLPKSQWHRWIHPTWESQGWRFIDHP